MICAICGKKFYKNNIKGVKIIQNGPCDSLIVKEIQYKDVVIKPCQECLLPFLRGIVVGRLTAGVNNDDLNFQSIKEDT